MKLTENQQQLLISKINSVWKNKTCEICKHQDWSIDDTVFELREFHGGGIALGSGAVKPVITLTCTNCFNVKTLNAIHLGLVNPNNPSTQKNTDKNE